MFVHCSQIHEVHEGIFIAFYFMVRVEIESNIKKSSDANFFIHDIHEQLSTN